MATPLYQNSPNLSSELSVVLRGFPLHRLVELVRGLRVLVTLSGAQIDRVLVYAVEHERWLTRALIDEALGVDNATR